MVQPTSSRIRPHAYLLWVALYAAILYLPFLGSARTLTAHEGMVSHPALRMLDNGEWIVPRYGPGWWLDKPPLTIWLTAGTFALLGFGEFAARLPAALAAIGLACVMAALARRLYDERTALLAGLMQATCVYALMQGRLGEIDMVLALLIAGAHVVLLSQWSAGAGKLSLRHATAFHLLVGLAVLAKGPVAAAIVGAGLVAFSLMTRSLAPLRAVLWTPGVLAFLMPVAAWHAAAYHVAGQEALQVWVYENLRRFEGTHHIGQNPPWYYWMHVPWLALPWSIVLVLAAPALWRDVRRSDSHVDRYLWAWFVGGILLLSLSAFKHKHYCIPALPPLTILAARALASRPESASSRRAGVFAFSLIAGAFVMLNGWVMPARDPRRAMVDFVRSDVNALPAESRLYVHQLGLHAAQPYITHACTYIDSAAQLRDDAVAQESSAEIWVLTLVAHRTTIEDAGLVIETERREPPSKYPVNEALVLLRVRAAERGR